MDSDKALQIINTLASGVDPITGEIHPDGGTLQHPDIIRALYMASMAIQAQMDAGKPGKTASRPGRAGEAWTTEEDRQLAQGFDEGLNMSELGRQHQRSRGAIQARLVKLGRITEDVGEHD
ncbi:hypothetical protein [Halomonas huangheensis]|uniref:Uncharacterized protein n=1 Tax=Halomonas huangheensis TaxID=1178482 RepID=W1NBU9_9GAMM|nr:hypothetical protein [Halomonas huangheensis]ALM52543.1 hypothetical protein AR456_09835 [Halomonas huangheensis]ERL52953.1 hypothetical protein BJB45_16870 [Halomonas huangheensis]